MLIQKYGQGPAGRRLFLKQTAALSTLGVASPLALNLAAMGSAAAQTAGDYKALVCIFLFGGNDAYNMVLPTDTASWNAYSTIRNQAPESIALLAAGTASDAAAAVGSPQRLGGVLPITPTNAQGRSFALHPLLGELQTMFNTDRRLAIVPNVGPLVLPTTKAQYGTGSHPKPRSLFSHNDQQNTWQSFKPEGSTVGWGGRLADVLASQNQRAVFSAISAAGNAVWLSGRDVRQYQVGNNGAIRMGSDANNRIYGSTEVAAAMERIVRSGRGGHVMEGDIAAVNVRSIDAELALRTALKPASDALFGTAPTTGNYDAQADPKLRYVPDPLTPVATAFNPLAQQLQIVARMIEAAGNTSIGAKRQVFFVSLGGFDTHDAQNRNQADLMARLGHAMRYFDTTLGALGARNSVTAFTASDFGRTFTSNGDGTDHGWGSHHFVMGGAVRGGDLYGAFPTLALKNANNNNFDASPDQLGSGSLLPTTAVDQLGATLAAWFGVSGTAANDVFPNLANFSQRDLGFMTA
jgi:uncharacterized protein (DUF1501 family)